MTSTAIKRITREYGNLAKNPESSFHARPLESNRLHCHFLLHGEVFHDTSYEGGVYHGVLQFPRNYPLSPPSVIMRTQTGRFKVNAKICFSMSDFHPEQWNPMWSIKSILMGLISFFNSEEITTGGMRASRAQRVAIAKVSLSSVANDDKLAREIFGDILDAMVQERGDIGDKWPPERIEVEKVDEEIGEKGGDECGEGSSSPPPPPPPEPKSAEKDGTVELTSRERRRLRREKAAAEKAGGSEISKAAAATKTTTPTNSPPPQTSTAASDKNRKKKERQKLKKQRQKHATSFLSNLSTSIPTFLSHLVSTLSLTHDIDVSSYPCDHVCYRTETQEEYDDLVAALNATTDEFELLVEGEIGGRMISTFSVRKGIEWGDGKIVKALEIPSPKEGSPYKSGLEHAEFVIPSSCQSPSSEDFDHKSVLQEFAASHNNVEWSFKATGKGCNPDVSVKVNLMGAGFGVSTVKFHLMPLPDVIEWEKRFASGGWEADMAASIISSLSTKSNPGSPFVIALAGGPGSGKTTAAAKLKKRCEEVIRSSQIIEEGAVLSLPMDGYHKPLASLTSPEEVYRRGCPSTFDQELLKRDLTSMVSGSEEVVEFPGWDHAVGDPIAGAHKFERKKHKVVIVEGLYLLLPSWGLRDLFDKSVFIRSDVDKCMEILKVRNACIPGYTKEEIEARVDEVDRSNAGIVEKEGGEDRADLVIEGYTTC